jgi:hypothetical protein
MILIVILGVWIGIAGPLFDAAAGEGWLRIAEKWQALIGSLIALAAAFWAARPVYQQLGEMRVQSAVQAYEMLRRQSFVLEEERRIAREVILQAQYSKIFEDQIKTNFPGHPQLLETYSERFDDQEKKLILLEDEFVASARHKWRNPVAQDIFDQMTSAMVQLRRSIVQCKYEIDRTIRACGTGPVNSSWIAAKPKIAALTVAKEADALIEACRAFIREIDHEDDRLSPMLQRAFDRAASTV